MLGCYGWFDEFDEYCCFWCPYSFECEDYTYKDYCY